MPAGGRRDRPDDPEGVVRAFFNGLADGDVPGVLALLHPDFVFRDAAGSFTAHRRDMGAMMGWDAEAGGRFRIEALEARDDVVTVRVREANRFTDLLDLDPWEVDATFTIRDGLVREEVARERVGEGPSFSERFHRAVRPVAEWAGRARPDDARAVFEAGRVRRYDGPTARRLLDLVVRYLQASGGSVGPGAEGGAAGHGR